MLGLNIALIARLAYGVLWGHVYPWTGIHLYGVCRAVVALGSGEFSSLLSKVSKIHVHVGPYSILRTRVVMEEMTSYFPLSC